MISSYRRITSVSSLHFSCATELLHNSNSSFGSRMLLLASV